MSDLDALLAVQELDTAADVLRHRRAHLPERAALAEKQAALQAVAGESAPLREERHRISRAQQAVEDEIALVNDKAAAVDAAMYGGGSTNAKELQAMQEELDALRRRTAALEDKVLEHMLEAEPVDEALAALEARSGGIDEEAVALTAALAEAETSIDAELEEIAAKRGPLAEAVDAALLARYEALRTRLKGVGVARLDGTKCLGCHLALPQLEVETVRRQAREEGIGVCPECDRLLVVATGSTG